MKFFILLACITLVEPIFCQLDTIVDLTEKLPNYSENQQEEVTEIFSKEIGAFYENDDYKLEIVNGPHYVSDRGYASYRIKITNKTYDYLLVRTKSSSISSASACDNYLHIIDPNTSKVKIFRFFDGYNHKNYVINFDRVLKIPFNHNIIEVADTKLTDDVDTFSFPDYNCKLLKSKIRTNEIVAKFDCTYTGDSIAVLDPKKSVLRLSNGERLENIKKYDPTILINNQHEDFQVVYPVLTKISKDDLKKGVDIIWKDTFKTSFYELLKPGRIHIILQ